MASRIALAAAALFWGVMNALLWQAEWGGRFSADSGISPELVWRRLLDSPDASVLSIRHQGRPIGTLEWHPSVLEAPQAGSTNAIEGMVSAPTGHHLRVAIRFSGEHTPLDRLMILGNIDLSASNTLDRLQVRVDQRPRSWEIQTEAGSDRVRLVYEEGRRRFDQSFETKNAAALRLMAAPYLAVLPAGLIPEEAWTRPESLSRSVTLETGSDGLQVGRSRLKVHRVTARLPGQLEATAFISRAGEILKVQLPDRLVLVNEAILGR